MNSQKIRYKLIILLVLLLVACSQATMPAPTGTPMPSETPVPPTSTASPSATALPSRTPKPTPTASPVPVKTETKFVIDDNAQKVLKSYGFDPQSGAMLHVQPEAKVLEEVVENSINWWIKQDLGALEKYVLYYDVRAESAAEMYACGAYFHTDNLLNYFNEGYRIDFVALPQGSFWGVDYIKDNQAELVSDPTQTSAFQYKTNSTTPFALIVDGAKVDFYSGSKLVGHFTSKRSSGNVGLFAYNISGGGKVKCTFENFWVWSHEE